MKKQRNMFQANDQDKYPEISINKIERNDLPSSSKQWS